MNAPRTGLSTVDVEGVSLHLAHPDELPTRWVGQPETMKQLLAAWSMDDPRDLPMNPRVLGKPGVVTGWDATRELAPATVKAVASVSDAA